MRTIEVDNSINSYQVILSDKEELTCQILDFSYLSDAKECASRLGFYLHPRYIVDLFHRKERAHFDEEGEFSHIELIQQRKLVY